MKVTAQSGENVQVIIQSGRHEFIADEPLGIGDDAGPDPYTLLLSSLAACTINDPPYVCQAEKLAVGTHRAQLVYSKNSRQGF